jgi:predicted  nucleic acid-binding Zn-ribbon protein
MNVARQLYQLQEVDLEIESTGRAIQETTSQLGESEILISARDRLASEQNRLDGLAHEQRSLEWEIEDLSGKLTAAQQELYGGRIRNPKELAALQEEVEAMRARRSQLEDKVLELMEAAEGARKNVADQTGELTTLEAKWRGQQQELSASLEQLKAKLTDLGQERQRLAARIDSQAIDIYNRLRKQRGAAVARVEQGMCQGCRISLPVSDLQRAKTGSLVQCSSCGRILFLP